MRWIAGPLQTVMYMLIVTLLSNVPLVVLCVAARRWLPPVSVRITLASGFAAACGYLLWRLEWSDVWRHGVPSLDYTITAYLPYLLVFGALGWYAGSLISPSRRTVA